LPSVSKKTYRKKSGQLSTYWQLTYYDASGKRKRKNFDKQAHANAARIKVEGELQTGTHIPDRNSVILTDAALYFLNDFERGVQSGKRERSTWRQYRGHIRNHIEPAPIAAMLVSQMQARDCRAFADAIQVRLSDAQAAKVMVTLRMILNFCKERGWIVVNPSSDVKLRRDTRTAKRITIPEKPVVKKLLEAAEEMGPEEYAFCCLGFFCGLRASELRGLPRTAVRLGGNLVIDQRADEWGRIGPPKTAKGNRVIPMGQHTAAALAAWLKTHDKPLAFPSATGTPMSYSNLWNRFWKPLHAKAGLFDPGKPRGQQGTLYGMHIMRHFCASLWIEQGYNPKRVQEMLGHATLAMTMDTYGHLFQDTAEGRKLVNAAEKSVMGTKRA
jgi:integrase